MPIRTSTSKPGLIWSGSFLANHSLALVNREMALALIGQGQFDLGLHDHEGGTLETQIESLASLLTSRLNVTPSSPLVTVRHHWPPDFRRPDTPRFVLIQPWEFGSLPASWVDEISRTVDECWVPSRYVKEVYESSGVPGEKVFVVPNGVNSQRFHPGVEPYSLPTSKGFKFLFVGGTIGRKGIDVLLDAYTRTFTDRDDVTLVIKDFGRNSFYSGQDAAALIAALQAKPGAPEIIYMTEDLTEPEIAGLYTACDALVHPYRGEGYGLPIAEAMACGRPTIVTGAGAAMDFADESTSLLIPAQRVSIPQRSIGDLVTVDQPWWYEPDVEALGTALRRLYEDHSFGRELGASAAVRIAEQHTWQQAAEIASIRLQALCSSAKSQRSTPRPVAIEAVSFENRKQQVLTLTREGKWAEAIREAGACLRVRQDDDLTNALAVAQFQSGDRDSAIELLRENAARSPQSRDFRHNLAFMLLADGDSGAVVEAAEHAIAAARISPEAAEIQRTLERAKAALQKRARKFRKTLGRESSEFKDLSTQLREVDAILIGQTTGPRTTEAEFTPARISLVMIAKNEEKFLEGCLESVRGAVDEIILVDTGSTDRTVEIAHRFGAKVVQHPWNEDFSEARNISLSHATGDWALWLDADERLAEGEGDLLKYLANAAEPQVGGYMVNIRNFMSRAEHAEVCWHRACRLFRLDSRIRFNGRIHEQNMRGLQDAGYVCALSKLTLDHYGYAADVMNERGKHDRFIRMLTREVEENPDEAYRTFHLFNLGNAYFTRGDLPNAATWLAQAAEGADPAEEYTALLFVEWATALYATSRAEEALVACEKADRLEIDHPGIDFARGHALLHLMDYTSSEHAFRSCISRGKEGAFVLAGDAGAYTYKAHYGLALALTGQERHAEAVEECRLALSESSRFVDARYLLANGLRRIEDLAAARAAFEELLAIAPSHPLGVSDYACTLHEVGDYPAALAALRRATAAQAGNVELWARLGTVSESLGLFEEARDAFLMARRLVPSSPEIMVNLGRAHAALGANSEALDCYTDAIHADPRYANAYFNAGDLLYQLGYYPKATETICAGLEVAPEHAPGFLVLGNCLAKLGELTAARDAFAQATARQPDYVEAVKNLELVEELLTGKAA